MVDAKGPAEDEIRAVCQELADLLVSKNKEYGDSALNPMRVFSHADPIEQIKVRIDDKLSRIAKGQLAGEDTEWDLAGYLVLLRIAKRRFGNLKACNAWSEGHGD